MSLDDFTGTKDIILQSNSSAVPYTFTFTVCSSATANDGFLPYNSNINTFSIVAVKSDGTVDTDLVDSSSESSNTITTNLNYPVTNGVGVYYLEFVLTLDSGAVLEADFKRIYAEDR